MLNLAILALGGSIVWTAFAFFANLMGRAAQGARLRGAWSLWACWGGTGALFIAWVVG
jgi:hypothetical protein